MLPRFDLAPLKGQSAMLCTQSVKLELAISYEFAIKPVGYRIIELFGNFMSKTLCISCYRPKATLHCGICEEQLCKNCVQFLEKSTFSYLSEIPVNLQHTYYCAPCYETHVEPALKDYNEIQARARGLYFFFTTQRKPIHLIKRSKDKIQVKECHDRNEIILRLAFKAAQQGYNAVIEAEVVSKKVRDEGYQKSVWSAVAVPANVDAERLERHDTRLR